MMRYLIAILVVLSACPLFAQTPLAVNLPREQRERFYNFTRPGSCVQCSLAEIGAYQNVKPMEMLLWPSEYGPAEHHGSGPSRVSRYCRERGVAIYNVTGEPTWDYMRWAAKTGRGAAIGAGKNHMQALNGYDPKTKTWYVWNNNSPKVIDVYSDAAFRRLHLASGKWCVILDYPPSPMPPAVSAPGWNTDIRVR